MTHFEQHHILTAQVYFSFAFSLIQMFDLLSVYVMRLEQHHMLTVHVQQSITVYIMAYSNNRYYIY